jgi:sulfopyruvate decarboxylase TPP-binding subunit
MKMHARADAPAENAQSWPEDIFGILQRFDVRQVPYVPDAGHSQLIESVLGAPSMRAVPLTTEEEGVALLAGAWAGGQRGVLLMQSSGVGNCVNMLSLTQIFRFPFLTLVTMRGEWGEFNPWQVPMGSSTQGVFELSGIKVLRASSPDEVRDVMEAGLQRLHAHRRSALAAPDRHQGICQMSKTNLLERRSVVSSLLKDRKDAVVVGGLGASTYDVTAAGDHDRNFYLWGAMGGAVMIGLGIALAQPKLPVVVITGDGEMLMGMGSLATVGLQKPGNLSIIVLDNEVYGETGGQASHTGASTDLVGIARCCGITDARDLATMAEIEAFAAQMHDIGNGPRFASVKIDPANLERVLSNRDGAFIVNRIRGALGYQPI